MLVTVQGVGHKGLTLCHADCRRKHCVVNHFLKRIHKILTRLNEALKVKSRWCSQDLKIHPLSSGEFVYSAFGWYGSLLELSTSNGFFIRAELTVWASYHCSLFYRKCISLGYFEHTCHQTSFAPDDHSRATIALGVKDRFKLWKID